MAIWPITRTRLGIWNEALRHLSEPSLATETDDIHARYLVEAAWEGSARFVIGDAFWNYFMKTVVQQPDASSSHPQYLYAFTKPTDWIKTAHISDHYSFTYEADFVDEAGVWYSNHAPLYIRYLSRDNANDTNIAEWPEEFINALGYYLAMKTAHALERSSAETERMGELYKMAIHEAKNRDVVNQANLKLRNDRCGWVAAMRRSTSAGRGDLQIQNVVDTSTGTVPIGDA